MNSCLQKCPLFGILLVTLLVVEGCTNASTSSVAAPVKIEDGAFTAQTTHGQSITGALILYVAVDQTTLLKGSILRFVNGTTSQAFGTTQDFRLAVPTGPIRCHVIHTSGNVLWGSFHGASTGVWSMYMLDPHKGSITAMAYEDNVRSFGVLILGVQLQQGMLLLPNGSELNFTMQPRKTYWIYVFNNSRVCFATLFSGGITARCPGAGMGWDARNLSFA